jgi:hypothetical protein
VNENSRADVEKSPGFAAALAAAEFRLLAMTAKWALVPDW